MDEDTIKSVLVYRNECLWTMHSRKKVQRCGTINTDNMELGEE